MDALPTGGYAEEAVRASAALAGCGAPGAREAAAWAVVAACAAGVGGDAAGGGRAGRAARAQAAETAGWLLLPLESIEVWGVSAGRPNFSLRVREREAGVVVNDFTSTQCREMCATLQECVNARMAARAGRALPQRRARGAHGDDGAPAQRPPPPRAWGAAGLADALRRERTRMLREAAAMFPPGEWTEVCGVLRVRQIPPFIQTC